MKKITIIIAAILLLCSCGNNDIRSKDIFAMNTYMNLKACGKNADTALADSAEMIRAYEALFSATKEDSEIAEINRNAGKTVNVSGVTLEAIKLAKEYGEKTDGALDITVYPIVREWGFTTGEYKIPDSETIAKLLENVDLRGIETGENTVKLPKGAQIDLGAVVKGVTADVVTKIIRSYGIDSAIISLGGNVQAIGRKPDGSLWRVGIVDPFSPGGEIGALSVEDKAVVTSGNYERYFTGSDGKRYCHIIDPESGYPVNNGIASVTVIGKSGAECDALSTALFVMGYEKAADFYRKNGGFDMVIISENGKVFVTSGIKDNAVFASGITAEVIE